jgi:hypothetical protein
MSATVRDVPNYGKAEILQWRIVNHEEMKEFLGNCYIAVLSKHTTRPVSLTFYERVDDLLHQSYARPGDYIVRTESHRFVAIDEEIWEAITYTKKEAA